MKRNEKNEMNALKSGGNSFKSGRQVALFAALLAGSGTLIAQATVPDAQVEANVLKALAGAPELSNEPIQTKTVYGTVTLSGSVASEDLRTKAETLASTAPGVKKVVDQLTIGEGASGSSQGVLQSDGSYAPADSQTPNPAAGVANPVMNNPDTDQAQYQQQAPAAGQAPAPQQQPAPYPQYRQPNGYPPPSPHAAQVAGRPVVVPAGAPIAVRINERLSSNHSQAGDVFDGIVVNDVYADGAIAIPRGAAVQGKVISATKSGTLKGRGEMSIQLTQLMLGGKVYPIVSTPWEHAGPDKSLETANKAIGYGAFGAILGAVAGGGGGAAIGAGVGAAAGVGSSAASGRGQVLVPAEAVVGFHLAEPASVTTVSAQEMQRLAYGLPYGPGGPAPGMYRRYPYGYPPPPPGYYPPAYPY